MPAHSPSPLALAVLFAGLDRGFSQQPAPVPDFKMHFKVLDKKSELDKEMDDMVAAIFGGPGGMPAPSQLRDPSAKHPPDAKATLLFPPLPPLPPLSSDDFAGLFPGPLIFDDSLDAPRDIFGSGIPDPLIMEMLGETHSGFQDDVVPLVHAARAARQAPNICHHDVLRHCADSRSQLHCLGKHQADISPECHDSVSKSVPFLCSYEIDQYCDIIKGGVLKCLEDHTFSLGRNCLDAVVATRSVITNVNTHTVSAANTLTGAIASVEPSLEAFADAVGKEFRRRAAQVGSTSKSDLVKYVLLASFFAAVVSFVYSAPVIYLPERFSSWRVARQLKTGQFNKLAGWMGHSKRESESLLVGQQMKQI